MNRVIYNCSYYMLVHGVLRTLFLSEPSLRLSSLFVVIGFAFACSGGGNNSVKGPLSVTVSSAVAVFQNLDDGGVDNTIAGVLLSTLSHDDVCRALASKNTSVQGSAIFVDVQSVSSPAVKAETYPIQTEAQIGTALPPAGIAGYGYVSRRDFYADGGTFQYNVDQSGTVTLTKVTFATPKADGGTQGGSISGNFAATLTVDGGSSSALSGSFDGTGCN